MKLEKIFEAEDKWNENIGKETDADIVDSGYYHDYRRYCRSD